MNSKCTLEYQVSYILFWKAKIFRVPAGTWCFFLQNPIQVLVSIRIPTFKIEDPYSIYYETESSTTGSKNKTVEMRERKETTRQRAKIVIRALATMVLVLKIRFR